jgi:hypothetical protein
MAGLNYRLLLFVIKKNQLINGNTLWSCKLCKGVTATKISDFLLTNALSSTALKFYKSCCNCNKLKFFTWPSFRIGPVFVKAESNIRIRIGI